MKNRFSSFPFFSAHISTASFLYLSLPLVALSACTVSSEVPADVAITPSGGESRPEMVLRLPPMRLANSPISAIDTLTEETANETVTVSGKVVQRAALLESWLYKIKDDSGDVWIRTGHVAPQVDQSVIVEGVVRYEAIVVDEIDASDIYIEEKTSREVNEPQSEDVNESQSE
ncbi:MAG: hypothetical protein AAF703_01915 [Cyanobacteria bacterium P01_D01_bin.105]